MTLVEQLKGAKVSSRVVNSYSRFWPKLTSADRQLLYPLDQAVTYDPMDPRVEFWLDPTSRRKLHTLLTSALYFVDSGEGYS